jgi:hypothetical protein
MKKDQNEEKKPDIQILREFTLTEKKRIRLSLLTFNKGTSKENQYVDIRVITYADNGRTFIGKGLSIPYEYVNVFKEGLTKMIDEAIEEGELDEVYFIDVGQDIDEYLSIDKGREQPVETNLEDNEEEDEDETPRKKTGKKKK